HHAFDVEQLRGQRREGRLAGVAEVARALAHHLAAGQELQDLGVRRGFGLNEHAPDVARRGRRRKFRRFFRAVARALLHPGGASSIPSPWPDRSPRRRCPTLRWSRGSTWSPRRSATFGTSPCGPWTC